MKFQIDTKEKTVKIEETVKIQELMDVLKKLLPDEWKSYSLITGTILNWYPSYPTIIYDRWNPRPYEPYYTTCGATYNVEVN